MFEQDIVLARLLLEKCQASQQRRDEVHGELRQREDELAEQTAMRQSRENYADILAKAAALLERPDLQVETPDTTDLETYVHTLRDEAEVVTRQASQFEDLLAELEARAPEIVATARGEMPEAGAVMAEADADDMASEDAAEGGEGEETTGEVEPAEEEEAAAEEPAAEDAGIEPEEDAGAELDDAAGETYRSEPAEEEDLSRGDDGYDAGNLLKRFNLHSLKTKEAFTYGRGAAYIVDASSVLERVPNYDLTIRGGEESALRDELLRDFDHLSRELSGTFYIVFDSWYHPLASIGNRVAAVYTTGDTEGTRDGAHKRIRDLIREVRNKHRSLCLVTNTDDLADQVRSDELFIISLADFFNF
jgi:hypothetical protein